MASQQRLPRGTNEGMLLRGNASNSLSVGLHLFFHPRRDMERSTTVVLLLYHALSMLLMAAISNRRADAKDHIYKNVNTREAKTFPELVRSVRGDGGRTPILNNDQVLTLRFLYELRNLAEHNILLLSEEQLRVFVRLALLLTWSVDQTQFKGRVVSHMLHSKLCPPSPQDTAAWRRAFRKEVRSIRDSKSWKGKNRYFALGLQVYVLELLDRTVATTNVCSSTPKPTADDVKKRMGVIGQRTMKNYRRTARQWKTIFRNLAAVEIQPDGGIILR